jgi:hypothetical protein
VILKYVLDPAFGGVHAIPDGSFFLSLQMQHGLPVMWWSVPAEPDFPNRWPVRTFEIAPTGPPGYAAGLYYVGTFQLGGFVGHVMSREPVPGASS